MTKINALTKKDIDKAKEIYFAAGGNITKCKPGIAKGINGIKNTTTRGKKNMTYNTSTPTGIRTMNFDSTYNIPTAYNGVKMMMDKF